MILRKVISGGQTGADRGGLKAARQFGLQTGGWMPRGFKALDGNHPEFADLYGMQEHSSPAYPPRTHRNVSDSDGTIRFAGNWRSPGEICTMKAIRKAGKPYLDVDVCGTVQPADAAEWIRANRIEVLNVAGNAEETVAGMEEFVVAFLTQMFQLLVGEQPHHDSDG
jgi:hypothetical protein